MSSSAFPTPISRQPAGTTFIVALCILGLIAGIQIVAVLAHFLPAALRKPAGTLAGEVSETPLVEPASAPAAAPPADARRIQELQSEADRGFRLGDFEAALEALEELGSLLPGNGLVQLSRAQVLDKMDQYAEAVMAFEDALKSPDLSEKDRRMAESKIARLSQLLGPRARPTSPSTGATAATPADIEADGEMRDEIGLRPGSQLGIVNVKRVEGKPGQVSLRISIKSRPGVVINTKDFQIRIYFYETDETGAVVLTEAKVSSQWVSTPIDWAENLPELVDVQYPMPESDLPGSASANGATGRKFYGFIIGVYYGSDLQDFRAEPGNLWKTYPLPFVLTE